MLHVFFFLIFRFLEFIIAQNLIESCVHSALISCSSNQTGKFIFILMCGINFTDITNAVSQLQCF
jgi:hypothetical protein